MAEASPAELAAMAKAMGVEMSALNPEFFVSSGAKFVMDFFAGVATTPLTTAVQLALDEVTDGTPPRSPAQFCDIVIDNAIRGGLLTLFIASALHGATAAGMKTGSGPPTVGNSPVGGDMRLSYPSEGGAFRYETGPQPDVYPFADISETEIDQMASGLDAPTQEGHLEQGDVGPYEPGLPQNAAIAKGKSPLSPPGEFGYGAQGAPPGGPYHGSMGRGGVDAQGKPVFFPAEIFEVLPARQTLYAVRVGPGGSYVDRVFTSKEDACAYADAVAQRGVARIRDVSALPETWVDGTPGNAVDMVRVFEIPESKLVRPVLHSGIGPQPEGTPGSSRVYGGGGEQVQLPKDVRGPDKQLIYKGLVTPSSKAIYEVLVLDDTGA